MAVETGMKERNVGDPTIRRWHGMLQTPVMSTLIGGQIAP
jgi:hypothetical protein